MSDLSAGAPEPRALPPTPSTAQLALRALTDTEAEGVEGMPVDAIQLAHQGDAELHHDADVRVLPLQVLRDRALCAGAGETRAPPQADP